MCRPIRLNLMIVCYVYFCADKNTEMDVQVQRNAGEQAGACNNGLSSSESTRFSELNRIDTAMIAISKMAISSVSHIEGSTDKALLVPSRASVDENAFLTPCTPLERTMSDSIQRLGVETSKHEQLCNLLEASLDKWGMNMFEVTKLSGNRPITVMLFTIFEVRACCQINFIPSFCKVNYFPSNRHVISIVLSLYCCLFIHTRLFATMIFRL